MSDIILRLLKREDLEMVRNWRNSEEVSSYMYSEKQISEEEQLSWFLKNENDNSSIYWVIEYNNRPLGLAYITQINHTLSSAYWAFYLGDTSTRGAGIGAKVEYQVINYTFDELKLNKLRCEVFAFNDKVIKMHEKFGFKHEAYYREHCPKKGKFEDAVGLAMLRSEWREKKDSMRQKIYGE